MSKKKRYFEADDIFDESVPDAYLYSAKAIYSTRQVFPAFRSVKYCMAVSRDSDLAVQDIGFVGGVVDTAAILAFVGASNGRVVAWYNQVPGRPSLYLQSGGVLAPYIVTAGVLELCNGFPSLRFDGVNNAMVGITSDWVNTLPDDLGGYSSTVIGQVNDNALRLLWCYDNNTAPIARVAQIVRASAGNFQSLYFNTADANATASVPVALLSMQALNGSQRAGTVRIQNGALSIGTAPLAGTPRTLQTQPTLGGFNRTNMFPHLGFITEVWHYNVSDITLRDASFLNARTYYGL